MGSKRSRSSQKKKRKFAKNLHCSIPEENDKARQQEETDRPKKKAGRPSKQNMNANLPVPNALNVDQGQQGFDPLQNEADTQEDFFFLMQYSSLKDIFSCIACPNSDCLGNINISIDIKEKKVFPNMSVLVVTCVISKQATSPPRKQQQSPQMVQNSLRLT